MKVTTESEMAWAEMEREERRRKDRAIWVMIVLNVCCWGLVLSHLVGVHG